MSPPLLFSLSSQLRAIRHWSERYVLVRATVEKDPAPSRDLRARQR